MKGLEPRELIVRGTKIVALEGGSGDPLVFLHGGGTFFGFNFAREWTDRFRVIVPYHPGFGASDVDPEIEDVSDVVLHYLQLFDDLELERVNLVGHSLGGWLAARFTVEHRRRVRRLVLGAPAGLHVPEAPTTDVFRISQAKRLPLLVGDSGRVTVPDLEAAGPDAIVALYREQTSLARLIWTRNHDPRLERWLQRIDVPTLILWGEEDRIIPVAQARAWAERISGAQVRRVGGAGHLIFNDGDDAARATKEFLLAR